MKKLLLLPVLAIAAFAGMNENGTYKCTETNSTTYYVLERTNNWIRDTKNGTVFYKKKSAKNDYGQFYDIYENGTMALQDYFSTTNSYLVNFFVFNSNGTPTTIIKLDCTQLDYK